MNCREFVDFLMAYVSGELPAETGAAFEQHIADCPPCIHYLESYRATLELEKGVFRDDERLLARAPEGLVKAVLAARKGAGGRDGDDGPEG